MSVADAVSIAGTVRSGECSAVAVVQQALSRIARHDGALNCFLQLRADAALAEAAALDRALAAGAVAGPLAGVPFAVKSLFDVAGEVTLAGSRVLADRPPAMRDAVAVARLRAAGAILLGQLNMDEFAYGFSTENHHYGDTANPHDPALIAGGSSGGSAAAVAAGLVALSLGSDTNGSIRVPASLCGVFGLKPTHGGLSCAGTVPFVPSLDTVGPFARTVRDLALAYALLRQPDAPPFGAIGSPPDALRVGVLGGWFRRGASDQALAAVARVADALEGDGAAMRPVLLPGAEAARSAAFCLTGAEGGTLHLPTLRARAGAYDPAVRDRLIAGALIPAAVVVQAERVRAHVRAQAARLFEEVDLLLAPATPFPAVPRGGATIVLDGRAVPARAHMGLFTQPVSFIGLPVVAVPAQAPADRLPIGVQLIGRPGTETLLLQVAHRLERQAVCVVRDTAHG